MKSRFGLIQIRLISAGGGGGGFGGAYGHCSVYDGDWQVTYTAQNKHAEYGNT